MSHLFLIRDTALRILHAILDSSKMVKAAQNALITALAVKVYSNARLVLLDLRRLHRLLVIRKLLAARKSVVMVSSMSINATMVILLMAMVAAANARKSLDGSAVEVHQASPVSARNSFLTRSNSHLRVLSIWDHTS